MPDVIEFRDTPIHGVIVASTIQQTATTQLRRCTLIDRSVDRLGRYCLRFLAEQGEMSAALEILSRNVTDLYAVINAMTWPDTEDITGIPDRLSYKYAVSANIRAIAADQGEGRYSLGNAFSTQVFGDLQDIRLSAGLNVLEIRQRVTVAELPVPVSVSLGLADRDMTRTLRDWLNVSIDEMQVQHV